MNIKRIVSAAATISIACLWAGYAAGYHRGVKDERQEWWSSAQQDSTGRVVFTGPRAKYRLDLPRMHNLITEKLTH